MSLRSGLFILALLATWTLASATALSPDELQRLLDDVARDDPDAIVVEVDIEAEYGGGIASLYTDAGLEYYMNVADGTIHGIEEERVDWDGVQIADEIRSSGRYISLPDAYRSLQRYMDAHPRYPDLRPEDFTSAKYTIEFRRAMVKLEFEGRFGDLEAYVDAGDGSVIEIEQDD